MKKGKVSLNIKGLVNLAQELNAVKKSSVQVGVLANKDARNVKSGSGSNIEIGRVHEFGDPENNIPQRSFLRMPIKYKSREFKKEAMTLLLALGKGKIKAQILLTKIGVMALNVIDEAFETSGWGTWPPLSGITIFARQNRVKTKKAKERIAQNAKPLIDTGQLRRSITFRIKK